MRYTINASSYFNQYFFHRKNSNWNIREATYFTPFVFKIFWFKIVQDIMRNDFLWRKEYVRGFKMIKAILITVAHIWFFDQNCSYNDVLMTIFISFLKLAVKILCPFSFAALLNQFKLSSCPLTQLVLSPFQSISTNIQPFKTLIKLF